MGIISASKITAPIMSGPPRAAIVRDADGVLNVVPVSGGKDSTALALELKDRHPEIPFLYICTPTGDELPEMVAHWARLGKLLGSRIWMLSKGQDLDGLIRQYDALPNWRQRWCTRQLKIEPYAEWLSMQVVNGPVVSYVGLRADEEARQGGDYRDVPNVTSRFPMKEWGWKLVDVLTSLERRGVCIPFRTDCARCYHQTLYEWWRLWHDNLPLYLEAEGQEIATGYTFRSPSRDTQPAALADLRAKFEGGYVPKQTKRSTSCRVCSK